MEQTAWYGILAGIGAAGLLAMTVSLYVGAMLADVDGVRMRVSALVSFVSLALSTAVFWLAASPLATAFLLYTIYVTVPFAYVFIGRRETFGRSFGACLAHLAVLTAVVMVFSVLILGGIERLPLLVAGENVFLFESGY